MKKHSFIAREGYPLIAIAAAMAIVAWFIHWIAFGASAAVFVFVVYFFRNPRREVPCGNGLVVSPADGKVIGIEEVEEKRFIHSPMKRISIFMSPLNVHVNRVPVTGVVKKVSYNKGKFFPAFAEKASLDNEQNAVVMECGTGDPVLFVQIAGWLARRIVCHAREGEMWQKGAVYGLIRFGSRVDVYVPMSYTIDVSLNQRVKAGESVIAEEKK
ncbi:MAG: phosphatidylserine decarboxylase family protein [Deltaproteobacteria bacterium]|nr:phosphatidylserine decarboxylase family protein [Deltaproteobacteria bacterium]